MATQPAQLDMITTHHAYLRVSTDAQDVDNQRHGILEYANANSFAGVKFTEDSASGSLVLITMRALCPHRYKLQHVLFWCSHYTTSTTFIPVSAHPPR